MESTPTILFAGGGTGGHIFPNLAIFERLRERTPSLGAIFIVSNRAIDAKIQGDQQVQFIPLPVKPFTMKPWLWQGFYQAWQESIGIVSRVITERSVSAVVATGGFVSGPAVVAARRAGVPVALANLDAVPGKANRRLARDATVVFSVYPTNQLPTARIIGLPMRRSVIGPEDQAVARKQLGLDPLRETLFVTGASQGASSLNRMMIEIVGQAQFRKAMLTTSENLRGWQILHLCGDKDEAELRAAYEVAGVPAKVMPFCNQMGLAWRSASIAISRAGAGSVAEVWANAVPTIFFPYPYHKDQHQRLNAAPLSGTGAAYLLPDLIEPGPNAKQLSPRIQGLMTNVTQRQKMIAQLRATRPADGAAAVAEWLSSTLATVAAPTA